jgi:hypothetical protein
MEVEMNLRKSMMTLAALLVAWLPVWAATINGTYTYDGGPVSAVHNDLTGAKVQAYLSDGSGDSVYGTVDTAAGTFHIEDVPVGESVAVQLELDRSQPSDNDGYDAGDLIGHEAVTVATVSDTVDVAVDVRSVMHFTSPFDSSAPVDSTFNSCPVGAAVDSPATVRWDAVPSATSYNVTVRRITCNHSLISQTVTQQSTTEIAVTLGTDGEDHVGIWLECTGSAGTNLCSMPFIEMQDVLAQAYLFHESGAGTGRGTDHADGFFIPAVARTSGVGTSYWSTAVTIVNTDVSEQQVEVVFTPRDGDGWTNYQTTDVTVAAGAARSWADVLQDLFSTTGAGSLEVRGNNLAVSSRTSTPAEDGGTYGLGIPPLAPGDLLSFAGDSSAFAGGVKEEPGVWRTNFAVCEVSGKLVELRVTVYDENGASLGSRNLELGPYKNTQINRVVRALTSTNSLDNGIVGVEVTFGTGTVGAFLTIIDDTTNDSTYTVIAPQSPTGGS